MALYWSRQALDRVLHAQVINDQLYLNDSHGNEYDAEPFLRQAQGDHKVAAQLFLDTEQNVAGFEADEDTPVLQENAIDFWPWLQTKADSNRDLRVETYGNKFARFKHYTGVQRRFNALVINSSKPKHVDLRHARGTHREVQKCVESGKRFQEVMTNIVETVERENLETIGIYCRAGHHRSVACAELLKRHIYPKADVRHLTISK